MNIRTDHKVRIQKNPASIFQKRKTTEAGFYFVRIRKTGFVNYLIFDSSSLYPNFLSATLRAKATSSERTARPVNIVIGRV